MIGRREFITLLGGAAAAWPVAARAQQPARKRRIGVLMALSESDPEAKPRVEAFEQGLQGWGWVKEQNLLIDYRWIGTDITQTQSHAVELVRSAPELIIANATPALAALRQETRTIPLIFVQVIDPVTRGFVATLARPGGNITGFTNFEFPMGSKWVEILKEIAPAIASVAAIHNPRTAPYGEEFFRQIKAAASSLMIEAIDASVQQPADLRRTIPEVAAKPHGGLIVIPDGFTSVHRDLIVKLAAEHRLPAIYPFRYFAASGGLVSYGVDSLDIFRRSASYVDLTVAVPDRLLALADEVIE